MTVLPRVHTRIDATSDEPEDRQDAILGPRIRSRVRGRLDDVPPCAYPRGLRGATSRLISVRSGGTEAPFHSRLECLSSVSASFWTPHVRHFANGRNETSGGQDAQVLSPLSLPPTTELPRCALESTT